MPGRISAASSGGAGLAPIGSLPRCFWLDSDAVMAIAMPCAASGQAAMTRGATRKREAMCVTPFGARSDEMDLRPFFKRLHN